MRDIRTGSVWFKQMPPLTAMPLTACVCVCESAWRSVIFQPWLNVYMSTCFILPFACFLHSRFCVFYLSCFMNICKYACVCDSANMWLVSWSLVFAHQQLCSWREREWVCVCVCKVLWDRFMNMQCHIMSASYAPPLQMFTLPPPRLSLSLLSITRSSLTPLNVP